MPTKQDLGICLMGSYQNSAEQPRSGLSFPFPGGREVEQASVPIVCFFFKRLLRCFC